MKEKWNAYQSADFYDELISSSGGARTAARKLVNHFSSFSQEQMLARRDASELEIREMGISFTVYNEGQNIDRAWPFDIIPRVIRAKDWAGVEAGSSNAAAL